MTLPNFVVLGSQMAGFMSLYHILRLHPEVYMSTNKKINYFFYKDQYVRYLEYCASCIGRK